MNDSYAATRIHVMKTKLVQEYEKLMKMSDSEIINYLQSTEYREDVDALDVKDLEDLESFDKILSSNGARTMKKLARISSERFKRVLYEALRQNDAWNLKIIAEAIAGGNDPKLALEQFGRQGTVDPIIYIESKTIADLASRAVQQFPGLRQKPETLADFVGALATPRKHKRTTRTQEYFIDERNILLLLRYKRENIAPERILRMFERGGHLSLGTLQRAARAKDLPETLHILRETRYKKLMDKAIEEFNVGTLVRFEYELHREMVRHVSTITRTYPLGVDVLLHYLAEKDIEHKNLRLLVKGKRLDVDEQFIRENLVV